jgi:hypothetical protein
MAEDRPDQEKPVSSLEEFERAAKALKELLDAGEATFRVGPPSHLEARATEHAKQVVADHGLEWRAFRTIADAELDDLLVRVGVQGVPADEPAAELSEPEALKRTKMQVLSETLMDEQLLDSFSLSKGGTLPVLEGFIWEVTVRRATSAWPEASPVAYAILSPQSAVPMGGTAGQMLRAMLAGSPELPMACDERRLTEVISGLEKARQALRQAKEEAERDGIR